jgi:uncharacterized membrane protein
MAVSLITAASGLAQTWYTITELPLPAGADQAAPYQINDQGFVVGCSSKPTDNGPTATVWKNGTVVLGRLKDGTYSIANAINSKGVIVGEGDDGDGRPLGWILSGGKLVNFFSNNGGNTHPIAINESGEVGGYYVKGFSSVWRGAIWKIDPKDARKSVMTTLPVLPGGDPLTASSVPWAFNKNFEAAGYCTNDAIGQHAVFWKNDAAHTIVDLGVFGSDWSSIANSLNDLGQVVGSSHPPFGSRAIVWQNDAAHTPMELPLLPGDNYGSATLINSQGVVLGWSTASEPNAWPTTPSRLVVWQNGAVYELQSLLLSPGGWNVVAVQSINNSGQMAALAFRDGVTKAVVLSPVVR